MKQKQISLPVIVIALLLCAVGAQVLWPSKTHALRRSIVFPVIGHATFVNDYYYARGNRLHLATDVMANKRQKLVAAVSGTITRVNYPQPAWGYAIYIEDAQGFKYGYLHMNDDTPGTNDGQGGGMHAYAPDMQTGNKVKAGQHIGWVGDSGHSNGVPHLHFEMYRPNDDVTNPYESLVHATRISKPRYYPQSYPELPNELLPFGTQKLGVSIDMGNFDVDPDQETIAGAGPGAGPSVRIFDANDSLIKSFYPFTSSFRGGVDVAAGDVDNDGVDEIITGSGPGAGRVRVFEFDGTQIGNFTPYGDRYERGVRVSAGDVDGDGLDEIITGTMRGGGPRVSAFELDGTQIGSFYAYSPDFKGGIDITSADVTGTAPDEIITGAGRSGGPRVSTFSLDGTQLDSFYAYGTDYKGGVRVSAGNVDTFSVESEILISTASTGSPRIKMYRYTGSLLENITFMEPWWHGPFDIAAGFDASRAAAGTNRRATIRAAFEDD